MTDITPARREALIDALLFGGIWAIHKADRRPSGDRHHSPVTINRLRAAGLVEWHYTTGQYYSGEYRLTERGKAVARSLDDTESSASRQHFIDTGAYLTYGDREELNPADELVKPEPKVNWEMLAPKVAEAAVLVAIGRGDERVQMYADSGLDEVYDGDIMALNLLKQLVEAGR